MSIKLLLAVFLVSSTTVLSERNPAISYISEEKSVAAGDTVELECTVENAQEIPVAWMKVDPENPAQQIVISVGGSIIVPSARYSVRRNDFTETYILTISEFQEFDSGAYECQLILNATDRLRANVLVHIKSPPVISKNSTSSVVTRIGSAVELQCYASGYPSPTVTWRRENNDPFSTGGTVFNGNVLTIRNVTKDDRGTYFCIAQNGVGRGRAWMVDVRVEFRPIVTIERAMYGQALHYDQILECRVEAYPSPTIVWMEDNKELHDSQHYAMSVFQTSDEFTDTTLRVINVDERHYGFYTCKASNKLGSDEKTIEFLETPNAICPPACSVVPNNQQEDSYSSLLEFLEQ